jgi:ariadne-1
MYRYFNPCLFLSLGVVYSLNKKGRWNLPEQIRKAVISDSLAHEDFKVSYLKQLKMHRRNTCVEYVASCGDIRQIVAKGQSYFNEKSIRGKKRPRKNPKRGHPLQPEYLDQTTAASPEHPEVHFDVYIPSKKNSVMTYNMKYIGRHSDVLTADDSKCILSDEKQKFILGA